MSVRVHLAAVETGLDGAANRDRAVFLVHRAAADGAALVVLPEYASRFDPRGVRPEHAEPLDGPFVAGLASAARETGVAVVAGTTTPAPDGDRAVNTVVALDGAGRLAGAYAKVHLYDAFGHRESDRFMPGPADGEPVVLAVGDLAVGVMTCYDLRFPESARRLVDAGATALAVPAAWAAGPHKADHWLTLLRARAIENTAYVLGVAQQGRGVTGASAAVDPLGVVVAGGDAPGSAVGDVVVADLDPAQVSAARETNPSLANRRYAVVPVPATPRG